VSKQLELKNQRTNLKPEINPDILTVDGCSKRSSIPERTLREYLSHKDLPHFKVGKRILIFWPEFLRWLEAYRVTRKSKDELDADDLKIWRKTINE
jgi:hypothetical protein